MYKEEYIRSKFRNLLSETIDQRVNDIAEKLNLDKETKLYKDNEFDYVQEGNMCEQCGSEMSEGECKECGGKSGEVMEDDNKLSKITTSELEDLLNDLENDFGKSRGRKERKERDEEINEKLYGKQNKLDKNKNGKIDGEDFEMLRKQQDEEEQLYEVEFDKELEEEETTEGNAFTGALAKAKKDGDKEFEVDGKKFNVKESILYTESDLIDMIERIVNEEKSKFTLKEPKGYKIYQAVHKADKRENENNLNLVAKKMTDYLKGASDEGTKYEMKETNKFPSENGGLKKGIRKKYTPSDAVDEYVDAFSYPGQTNLRFDEIKPNKKNIEKYLKGDSTTGNAQVDKDGNALGNVVPSGVGEKFYKNFEENLYGQEQADASYKRQSQPVDVAGDDTENGTLKSKRPKGGKTAQSVLNKLDESVKTKEKQKLNEEFEKIQKLMGYNKRTQ